MALTTGTEFLPFERVVSVEGCQVLETAPGGVDTFEWPCGLRVSRSLVDKTPGVFWDCLKAAHHWHHALGHKGALIAVESATFSADSQSVTVTFSCGWEDMYGRVFRQPALDAEGSSQEGEGEF